MQKQLKTRQICLFFIAFLPITKLFAMPSILASISGRNLWLSAFINVALDIITLAVLIFVSKKTDKTFFQMLSSVLGERWAKIISLLYVIYFLFKSAFPIMEQKDYINATLYIAMPSPFYFLPFFAVAFYLCSKKLRVLGRLSDVLFTFSLSGYFLLIILSLGNADFGAILPVGKCTLGEITKGSYSSLAWFGDSVYFLFFVGNYAHSKGDGLKIIGSYMVNAIMVIFFLIVFYGVFTFIAFRQRFALTDIAKYTSVISNTGRFDYLASISLLFSYIISVCLPLFFASKLMEQVFPFKSPFIPSLISVAVSFTLSIIFTEYYYSIESFMITTAGFILLFFGNVFPIFFIFFNEKNKKGVKAKNEEKTIKT